MDVIKEFVSTVASPLEAKPEFKGLRLFNHFLTKIDGVNGGGAKMMAVFKDFSLKNLKALTSYQISDLNKRTIKYSDKCKFNVVKVMNHLDADSVKAVWNYLLIIGIKTTRNEELIEFFKSGASGIETTSDISDVERLLSEDNPKLHDFLTETRGTIDQDLKSANSPQELITSLAESGKIAALLEKFEKGVNDGVLNPEEMSQKLLQNIDKLGVDLGDVKGLLGMM